MRVVLVPTIPGGLLGAALALVPLAAVAQDEDPFGDVDDDAIELESDAPPPPPAKPAPRSEPRKAEPKSEPKPPPKPVDVDDEGDIVLEDEEPVAIPGEPSRDLAVDDEDEPELAAPGTDTPAVYRAEQARLSGLPADEEALAWEAYLELYPNSLFRDRIEARAEALEGSQYRERITDADEAQRAELAELRLVQPLHLPNLNPRSQVSVALDAGFPGYFGGLADFEWAFLRNVSVHGGVAGRYDGWGLEVGARYAFAKSARRQVVATVTADLRLGFAPLVFQVRPQLGVGKIWSLKQGMDVQLLASAGARIGTLPSTALPLTDVTDYFGVYAGLNLSVRVAPAVGVFLETDVDLRNLDRAAGLFAYHNLTLGLRFFPKLRSRADDPLDVAVSGRVPVVSRYTSYGIGGVAAQGAYRLPSRWLSSKAGKRK